MSRPMSAVFSHARWPVRTLYVVRPPLPAQHGGVKSTTNSEHACPGGRVPAAESRRRPSSIRVGPGRRQRLHHPGLHQFGFVVPSGHVGCCPAGQDACAAARASHAAPQPAHPRAASGSPSSASSQVCCSCSVCGADRWHTLMAPTFAARRPTARAATAAAAPAARAARERAPRLYAASTRRTGGRSSGRPSRPPAPGGCQTLTRTRTLTLVHRG